MSRLLPAGMNLKCWYMHMEQLGLSGALCGLARALAAGCNGLVCTCMYRCFCVLVCYWSLPCSSFCREHGAKMCLLNGL